MRTTLVALLLLALTAPVAVAHPERHAYFPNGAVGAVPTYRATADQVLVVCKRNSAKRIRRYWEVQAWLVVEGEEAMMEEAAGDAIFDADQVRAAFAELEGLRTALGRSTFTALQALLPFSRNDLWEVAELRQRLHGRSA